MKTVTPTELRGNIYHILDEILETGIPIEVVKGDQKLLISPVKPPNKLQNLKKRKNVIKGDPNDLVSIKWDEEINLDLP